MRTSPPAKIGVLRVAAWLTAVAVTVSGCMPNEMMQPKINASLVKGPPVQDIVTSFDKALKCLRGKVTPSVTFGVGAILDQTGKEQVADGGVGKFVTQGAGDVVQSALFRTGVTVLNRRDPRVFDTEAKWGIRTSQSAVPTNYFITGSINSLDFIPGGGLDVLVAGVGPKYREHRILVGLDLAMTQTSTGRVVANVPLQKQIFANEFGGEIGRFLGNTLVSVDLGGRQREAMHFALRQMLMLATFELLTQLMSPGNYIECRKLIDSESGRLNSTLATEKMELYQEAVENGGLLDPKSPPASGDKATNAYAAPKKNGARPTAKRSAPKKKAKQAKPNAAQQQAAQQRAALQRVAQQRAAQLKAAQQKVAQQQAAKKQQQTKVAAVNPAAAKPANTNTKAKPTTSQKAGEDDTAIKKKKPVVSNDQGNNSTPAKGGKKIVVEKGDGKNPFIVPPSPENLGWDF